MSKREIRQDITGLRAIAVLAVTLFHVTHLMNPESAWLKGGFLGVDIFFVISGFLMTMLIMHGLDQNNFSLFDFYKRRAKRICPALAVVILVFTTISFCIFDPIYVKDILREALRALIFISNLWYARFNGYFDRDAEDMMFLHTWSLSVEWQFYLIYPIVLIFLNKILPYKYIGLSVLALTCTSLGFGCFYTSYNPVNSYYFFHSRAYELLIGALAYFYPLNFFTGKILKTLKSQISTKLTFYTEALGIFCIGLSFLVVDSSKGWPTWWSLLPLLGTYLCIAANNPKTILSNTFFQKIGLWSYAIYLVHWPILVMVNHFFLSSSSWLILSIILILGIALHYGVERKRNFAWGFLGFYILLGISTQATISLNKFTPIPQLAFAPENLGGTGLIEHYGDLSRPVDLILVGDSFARQYVKVADASNLHVAGVTFDGCYSAFSGISLTWQILVEEKRSKCLPRYQELIKAAQLYPQVPIVWAQNWSAYKHEFIARDTGKILDDFSLPEIIKTDIEHMYKDLGLTQRKLYVLGESRTQGDDVNVTFAMKCYALHVLSNPLSNLLSKISVCKEAVPLFEPTINITLKQIIDKLPQNQSAQQHNIIYLDISPALCSEEGCRIMRANTFEPFFSDKVHFTKYGAEPVFNFILQKIGLIN